MDYIEVNVTCDEAHREIITAELAEVGFESFLESESGLQAYIPVLDFEPSTLHDLTEAYPDWGLYYSVKIIAQQNWNEECEKNYEPIRVEDEVLIRADFHQGDPKVPYEIIINPKMSFGTGHHATTYLMVKRLLTLEVGGKRVYDVGTGTGILAIMASKLGASHVEANDVEQWTVENCRENCQANDCPSVQVYYGSIGLLAPRSKYDIMLANINRNVLLEELPHYFDLLHDGGDLLLSGFYDEDVLQLVNLGQALGFVSHGHELRNGWACLHLQKN